MPIFKKKYRNHFKKTKKRKILFELNKFKIKKKLDYDSKLFQKICHLLL